MTDGKTLAPAVQHELAIQWPKFKTELVKDIQATLVKSDYQAATLSAQFFKMDHSLFKWDEKGFTFAGKQISTFSLQTLVHGGRDAEAATKKKENERLEAEKAKAAREQERERIKKFEEDLMRHVRGARNSATTAHDVAVKAQHDAQRADNLLRSANHSARLAADNASRASQKLGALEERVVALESHI
ncbi:hypothetical protein GTY65_32480 [Streptomyces sp. SID8379]|uniref:hypothetical protein n=1 Tax=unclassified Streptomyces TaxID=2593676 RepID=UPI00035C98D0|nr:MULTISPECIES: hypothetical protein [unclassified Streptomyces]MYW68760.1 hypothetical protein [Streptomyces sp. SID8379]